jgi:hypothetical protein
VCVQELGEVDALPAGQFGQLGAAREAVGEHHGIGGGADRREQGGLGHRDGDVVVAAFRAEVAGQAAATADGGHLGARPAQQLGVG